MQTDHFVPLVVPGLSTNSGSNSSSTSTLQDLSSPRAKWRTGPRRLVRITSSKTQNRNEKRDGNRNSDDRVRELPEWLEEFTDNLEDTEVHAPAHISQDSDSERPTKVLSTSRKHSIHTHFPQWSKLRSLLANKNDKGSLQKTHWRSSTSSRKVWWLDNSRSQSPHRGGWITEQSSVRCRCSRSCHSMVAILSVQNQSLLRRRKRVYESSSSRYKSHKLYFRSIHWNLENLVKIYPGITALQTLHQSETNGIAETGVRRVNEGSSAVLLLIKIGWKMVGCFLMKCYCHLRNVEDLLAEGKTPCERRFGEPLKGPIIPFGAMVEYHPISVRDQSRLHQFGKTVQLGIFLGYELIAVRIWKGDILIADLEEFAKVGRIRNLSSKNERERSIDIKKKGDQFIFP